MSGLRSLDGVETLELDVSSPHAWEALAESIRERSLEPSCLVNVAGIAIAGRLDLTTPDQISSQFAVNVDSVIYGTRYISPLLTNDSTIVNIASVSGLIPSKMLGVYGATKAAVISLTKTAAVELAPKGVRVNAIAPGVIHTGMWTELDKQLGELVGREPGKVLAAQLRSIPLGRYGTPADVAAAVAFLASDAAGYITGQTLNVDGGLRM